MAVQRPVRVPRYRQIQDEIAGRIVSGEYRAGQALPPQRNLAASLGVTLMTLRQALRELSDQGLLVQEAGRGTFVLPKLAAYRPGQLCSFADDLRQQGLELTTVVRQVRLKQLSTVLADALGRPSGENGLRLERVREVAGAPVAHQVSWVPEPYARALRKVDFTVTPLYQALAQAGARVAEAAETVRPAVLTQAQAEPLGVRSGTAVFRSERITRGADGAVLVLDRAVLLGDRFSIRSEHARQKASVRWNMG